MDFQILSVLEPAEVKFILGELGRRTFADGKLSAHGNARAIKNNLQAERNSSETTEIDGIFLSALRRNEDFQNFAIPRRVQLPLFSRYEPGMEYGAHIDSALMGAGDPMRTDLAFTLFLSEPDTYDGGELAIELASGEQEIKLGAGEGVCYSAKSLHRVTPVTRGVRLVAVTWIQSAVRDERIRAILVDLSQASRELNSRDRAGMLVNKAYHNLIRISAEL